MPHSQNPSSPPSSPWYRQEEQVDKITDTQCSDDSYPPHSHHSWEIVFSVSLMMEILNQKEPEQIISQTPTKIRVPTLTTDHLVRKIATGNHNCLWKGYFIGTLSYNMLWFSRKVDFFFNILSTKHCFGFLIYSKNFLRKADSNFIFTFHLAKKLFSIF